MKPTKKTRPEVASIAAGTRVRGTLSGAEDLRIFGRFLGSLELQGTVTVEASGEVDAEISADVVRVFGRLCGAVSARALIELRPGAVVTADLRAPRIAILPGAQVKGAVRSTGGAASEAPRISPPRVVLEVPAEAPRAAPLPPAPPPPVIPDHTVIGALVDSAPPPSPPLRTPVLPRPTASPPPPRVLSGGSDDTQLPPPMPTEMGPPALASEEPGRRRVLVRFKKRGDA
ncbi:MAG: polymer-forming cytoskeletal protein [Myxococcota bacterium]